MKTIEEIIQKNELEFDEYTNKTIIRKDELILIMKEYAELYAKKCLEIAAENANIFYDVGGYNYVDSGSILNIKLPEHEEIANL